MSEPTSSPVFDRARERAVGMLPMLREWIETNSYSADVEGVNRMGDHLAASFDLPGLTLERLAGDGVGDHLIWKTPAWDEDGAQRLALIGHHDTVFPPGAFDVWELDGDRLRGPGVLDMKGGLATIWAALSALADDGALAAIPLAFISVGDEEIGSPHSGAITTELVTGAAAALVFEAGRQGDAIITRRKGTGAIVVEAHGVAAHAGNHHADGVNAIRALARFIDKVEDLTDYDLGVTVNVGLIRGGEARNTVPGHARCEIDFRFIQHADGITLVESVTALAAELSSATGARLEVSGGIRRPSLERSDASAALCQRYSRCAVAAGLDGPEAGLIGGGSDASTASAAGVPSIDGLGPRGAGFHTYNEHIEVSSLALRADALARFIASWPG